MRGRLTSADGERMAASFVRSGAEAVGPEGGGSLELSVEQ